jgi:hypothetical protein
MKQMLAKIKRSLLVRALNLLFASLSWIRSERIFRWSYSLIALLAEKLAKKDYYVKKIRWIKEIFDSNHPSLTGTKKILRGTNPHHRKTLIKTLIINQALVGTNERKDFSISR